MAYPRKLLSEDEQVVLETHPHWKVLVAPVLELLVVLAAAGFLFGRFEEPWARWTTAGVAVVLVLVLFGVPFLKWRTTLFVFTTKRVVTRSGVLTRSGRDVPLNRINDVSFSENLLERVLRCGTLTVESAGERGQVVLADVPRVAEVQHQLYELIQSAGREA
ncbi:MAG TPA: PH domain-containing protein [Mycobacteriales bacterium]|nr:PH domain-containing protein [Mycobacteriales bacterium]